MLCAIYATNDADDSDDDYFIPKFSWASKCVQKFHHQPVSASSSQHIATNARAPIDLPESVTRDSEYANSKRNLHDSDNECIAIMSFYLHALVSYFSLTCAHSSQIQSRNKKQTNWLIHWRWRAKQEQHKKYVCKRVCEIQWHRLFFAFQIGSMCKNRYFVPASHAFIAIHDSRHLVYRTKHFI